MDLEILLKKQAKEDQTLLSSSEMENQEQVILLNIEVAAKDLVQSGVVKESSLAQEKESHKEESSQ
ncbi:hypothetical protein KI387_005732, partial [Taxus chinensis]